MTRIMKIKYLIGIQTQLDSISKKPRKFVKSEKKTFFAARMEWVHQLGGSCTILIVLPYPTVAADMYIKLAGTV